MHLQTDTQAADKKPRELEDILHYNQNILDRIIGFERRLGILRARLSGDSPKAEDTETEADICGGIMGQLQSTHQASSTRCDAIADWLDKIEYVV